MKTEGAKEVRLDTIREAIRRTFVRVANGETASPLGYNEVLHYIIGADDNEDPRLWYVLLSQKDLNGREYALFNIVKSDDLPRWRAAAKELGWDVSRHETAPELLKISRDHPIQLACKPNGIVRIASDPNGACPRCGGPAYVGFRKVECEACDGK